MTFEGLPLGELAKLFAIFGGAMVVLYILKLRRRRVEVPFSPLWSRVVEDRQSSSLFKALKRIGSLLVQLALIAIVLFALADPKVAGSFAGCDHEEDRAPPPRHALVILDASASMSTIEGGRSRLERARAEAERVITGLAIHPSQKVMLVQLDATTRPLSLWSSDKSALLAALARYGRQEGGRPAALDTPTALDDALSLARDALRGKAGAEVILVTDRAFSPIDTSKLENLDFRVIPVGEAVDNVGIESFNVRPYLDDSVTYVAWYAVRNETPRPVKANLRIYANPKGLGEVDFDTPARLVHTEPLTLPPGETLTGQVAELKFEGSRLMARVAVDTADPTRDAFPRDDVAFAVVPERRVLNVQLVTEGNLFLQAALFLRENIALKVVTPAGYRGPEGFDVTVVDAVDVDVSRPGHYVLFEPRPRDGFEIKGRLESPVAQKLDKKHPLARHLSLGDANILEAPVYALQKASGAPQKGDEVVAAAQGGAPLIFARRFADGRRAVVVAFDIRKSLLPMSYSFPILVVNAVSWFASDPDGLLQPNRAGRPLSLAYAGKARDFEVVGPEVAAPPRKVGERLAFTAPRLGIFELRPKDGGEEDKPLAVAINLLSPDESRVTPRGEYPAWEAPAWTPPVKNEWLEDLWRLALMIALGVMLIEWFTWHRRWTI